MKTLLALSLLAVTAPFASAHVTLDPPRVEAGTTYRGVLRVGHGCDAAPTTSVDVQLPGGTRTFQVKDQREFPVEFPAPAQPGALWVKAVQHCGATKVAWADVPAAGATTEGMKTPAMLVQVVDAQGAAAYAAQPAVEGAWVRASVPGQQTTGAFMRITAKEPTQLVRASSPVAGTTEVHEMKMEGDVMRMRPAGPIDLPVGRVFELKPGGYHLMLQELKKPLASGSTVPVTLVFRSAKGVETRMDLKLPVALQPPAGGPADHKH